MIINVNQGLKKKLRKILDLTSFLKDDQVFFAFHPLVPKTFGRVKKGEKYTILIENIQPLIRIINTIKIFHKSA